MGKRDMTPQSDARVLPGYKFIGSLFRRVFRFRGPVFRDRSRFQSIVQPLFWLGIIFLLGQTIWIYNGVQINRAVFAPNRSTSDIPMGPRSFFGALLEEKVH